MGARLSDVYCNWEDCQDEQAEGAYYCEFHLVKVDFVNRAFGSIGLSR